MANSSLRVFANAGLVGLAYASCYSQGGLDPTYSTAGSSGQSSSGGAGEGGAPQGASGEAGSPARGCVYTDRVEEGEGGEPGEGGAAGAYEVAPGISVRTSVFGGLHLTDSEGRPLYTYGGDIPGDCHNAPIVGCDDLCQTSWLSFDDPAEDLDPVLDPGVFGSGVYFEGEPPEADRVSTYYGWPLYYWGAETLGSGSVPKWTTDGVGSSRLWHLAKVRPPNIVIMRYRVDATTTELYLASGSGMALYAYANDTCTGDCLDGHAPFSTDSLSAVSSLDTSELSLLVRSDDGALQVAYKGAPLYLAAADQKPGDKLGQEAEIWSLVSP